MKVSGYFILFGLAFEQLFAAPLLLAENIQYESKSPYEFSEVITDLEHSVKTPVTAKLTWPTHFNPQQQYPLVIAIEDTLGFEKQHHRYFKALNQNGIATLEIYSFASRNVDPKKNPVQNQVSPEMMATDAYFAFEKLIHHPNILPHQIGLLGWGSGGGAVLYAAWEPAKQAYLKDKPGFAAFMAIYPPCLLFPTENRWVKAPVKIIIGEKDQSTSSKLCSKLVDQIKTKKDNVSLNIMPHAYHSFDSEKPVQPYKDQYSFSHCEFLLNSDGVVLQEKTGIKLINPLLRLAAFYNCAEKKSVLSGKNTKAKRQTLKDVVGFFKESLSKRP